jgi:hypothetical protein
MPFARRHVLAVLLTFLIAAILLPAAPAAAQMTDPAETIPRIRAHQRAMLMKKKMRLMSAAAARHHVQQAEAADAIRAFGPDRLLRPSRASALAAIAAAQAAPARATPTAGAGRRRTIDEIEPGYVPPTEAARRARLAQQAGVSGFVPPANVSANNRAGDGFASGQCEQDIAAHGSNILVAWNDGEGFNDLTGDTQGYGYSTNGGATFTDGGKLPKPAGFPTFIWTSDPIVTVNEKTGEFWYAGLCSPSASNNGIAVVKGTFSGSTLNWGAPVIVRSENDFQFFLDKLWMVADSASGNLYLTYTEFNTTSDEINFKRSTNGGALWSSDFKINAGSDDGAVQGSRPAVGPNGEVHVVYYTIGPSESDFMKHRLSTNAGTTFGPISIAATFHPNFGTGAPGFNREMGIQFPSIAVDRSGGLNRGRVYVAWNESVNWLDEAMSTGVGKYEVEPNGTPAQATPITIGQPVRGFLSTTAGENDYFSFSATAGQSYIFWSDSLNANLLYTMRIFCTDQTTRLSFSGDTQFGGGNGFMVWTAPANGTYYLRMANLPPGSATTGGYRILTKVNTPGAERSRDQRDVFVASSITNGLSWSTPTRVNDDAGLYDNWLPEIEVGGNGLPYVIWYDWRDSPATCGGRSHVYLARSDDAGATWASLGPVTTAQSDWTNGVSNIAPNQGDYLALYANNTGVYNAWADARNGDPDVYVSVWTLAFTPVQIALASVSAKPDRVDIVWFAGGDPLDQAIVERRTEMTDWAALSTIYVDGNSRLSFTDTNVEAGERYAYRLRIEDAGAERFVGETRVDVPSRTRLAIANIRPNPARRDAWVTFSLPNAAPATLSLLDIAGRMIREREVGSFGAGTHQLNLVENGALEPGLYLVRVTQGGSSETSRLTVVK